MFNLRETNELHLIWIVWAVFNDAILSLIVIVVAFEEEVLIVCLF